MKKSCAFDLRPVAARDGPIVETLFGPRGATGGCWCMYWRREKGGKSWDAVKGEPNRVAFLSLLAKGKITGVLAFAEGRPIGWCSVGPKTAFPRFAGSRVLARASPKGTWSINCFFIPPPWRNKGVASGLIEEAVRLAKNMGASEVEAYPTNPPKSGAMAPAFAWTGVPGMFKRAKFKPSPENPRVWHLKFAKDKHA